MRRLLAYVTKGNWVRRRTFFSQSKGSKRFQEESILVITKPRAPWGLGHLIFISENSCCDLGSHEYAFRKRFPKE